MKKYILIVTLVLLAAFLILIKNGKIMSDFLAVTKKVNANVLVAEGWLPDSAIKKVLEEFRNGNYELILTTGIRLPKYFAMGKNGFLVFHTDMLDSLYDNSDNHSIEIKAYSELSGQNCAFFNIHINDSLIRGYFADKRRKRYEVNWNNPLNEVDSILIEFTNDNAGNWGDRNLFVGELIIDHKIRIPYKLNSAYDIGPLDGENRIMNNLESYAGIVRDQLILFGIDPDSVIAAPLGEEGINRTLSCALAVRTLLESSYLEAEGINIISMGTHSRRTWMIYNKLLGTKYKIGIIALPDPKNTNSYLRRTLKAMREYIGIIYYRIILLTY